MKPQSLSKLPSRPAAASSAAAATSASAPGHFSRCQAFASILLNAGITPASAFSDVWICSLAQQIIPEVSRPMLSILMQNPHHAMSLQVRQDVSLVLLQRAPEYVQRKSRPVQHLLSIFSVPDAEDLKLALQQLLQLGIVVLAPGAGGGSSGSGLDSNAEIRVCEQFHASMSAFHQELPPPPLLPLRTLAPDAAAAIAAWAQQARAPPPLSATCRWPRSLTFRRPTAAPLFRARVPVPHREASH